MSGDTVEGDSNVFMEAEGGRCYVTKKGSGCRAIYLEVGDGEIDCGVKSRQAVPQTVKMKGGGEVK